MVFKGPEGIPTRPEPGTPEFKEAQRAYATAWMEAEAGRKLTPHENVVVTFIRLEDEYTQLLDSVANLDTKFTTARKDFERRFSKKARERLLATERLHSGKAIDALKLQHPAAGYFSLSQGREIYQERWTKLRTQLISGLTHWKEGARRAFPLEQIMETLFLFESPSVSVTGDVETLKLSLNILESTFEALIADIDEIVTAMEATPTTVVSVEIIHDLSERLVEFMKEVDECKEDYGELKAQYETDAAAARKNGASGFPNNISTKLKLPSGKGAPRNISEVFTQLTSEKRKLSAISRRMKSPLRKLARFREHERTSLLARQGREHYDHMVTTDMREATKAHHAINMTIETLKKRTFKNELIGTTRGKAALALEEGGVWEGVPAAVVTQMKMLVSDAESVSETYDKAAHELVLYTLRKFATRYRQMTNTLVYAERVGKWHGKQSTLPEQPTTSSLH